MTDQKQKVTILTGATAGIGKETARGIARHGGTLVIGCRNLNKGEDVRRELIETTGNKNIEIMHCDLASIHSIKRFVTDFKKQIGRASCRERV